MSSYAQDPETKPAGELTEEQASEVSGGINPQPLPPSHSA
jgi:hypothetical protein